MHANKGRQRALSSFLGGRLCLVIPGCGRVPWSWSCPVHRPPGSGDGLIQGRTAWQQEGSCPHGAACKQQVYVCTHPAKAQVADFGTPLDAVPSQHGCELGIDDKSHRAHSAQLICALFVCSQFSIGSLHPSMHTTSSCCTSPSSMLTRVMRR